MVQLRVDAQGRLSRPAYWQAQTEPGDDRRSLAGSWAAGSIRTTPEPSLSASPGGIDPQNWMHELMAIRDFHRPKADSYSIIISVAGIARKRVESKQ